MQTNSIDIINIYNEVLYANISDNLSETAILEEERDIMIFCTLNEKNDECATLLNNLLKACKLESNTFHLIYISETSKVFDFIKKGRPKKILSFGVPLKTELFQLLSTPYKITDMNDKQVLMSEGLNILQQSKEKKAQLWASLQLLFNING